MIDQLGSSITRQEQQWARSVPPMQNDNDRDFRGQACWLCLVDTLTLRLGRRRMTRRAAGMTIFLVCGRWREQCKWQQVRQDLFGNSAALVALVPHAAV